MQFRIYYFIIMYSANQNLNGIYYFIIMYSANQNLNETLVIFLCFIFLFTMFIVIEYILITWTCITVQWSVLYLSICNIKKNLPTLEGNSRWYQSISFCLTYKVPSLC